MLTNDEVITTPPPVTTPTVTTPPVPPAPDDAKRLWFKEIVTASIAFVVLGALLVAYYCLGGLPSDAKNLANVDKISTALFGIFAAFVGYYAGRVPAEKAAADSQANAQQAQQTSVAAMDNEKDMARKLEQELVWSDGALELLDRSAPLLASGGGGGGLVSDADGSKAALANEITRHVRRRNRRI